MDRHAKTAGSLENDPIVTSLSPIAAVRKVHSTPPGRAVNLANGSTAPAHFAVNVPPKTHVNTMPEHHLSVATKVGLHFPP